MVSMVVPSLRTSILAPDAARTGPCTSVMVASTKEDALPAELGHLRVQFRRPHALSLAAS